MPDTFGNVQNSLEWEFSGSAACLRVDNESDADETGPSFTFSAPRFNFRGQFPLDSMQDDFGDRTSNFREHALRVADVHHTDHFGQRRAKGQVLFCARCGAYSYRARHKLSVDCLGKHGAGLGLQNQRRRLLAEKFPSSHGRFANWTIANARVPTLCILHTW